MSVPRRHLSSPGGRPAPAQRARARQRGRRVLRWSSTVLAAVRAPPFRAPPATMASRDARSLQPRHDDYEHGTAIAPTVQMRTKIRTWLVHRAPVSYSIENRGWQVDNARPDRRASQRDGCFKCRRRAIALETRHLLTKLLEMGSSSSPSPERKNVDLATQYSQRCDLGSILRKFNTALQ
jgi:hypothetical protein